MLLVDRPVDPLIRDQDHLIEAREALMQGLHPMAIPEADPVDRPPEVALEELLQSQSQKRTYDLQPRTEPGEDKETVLTGLSYVQEHEHPLEIPSSVLSHVSEPDPMLSFPAMVDFLKYFESFSPQLTEEQRAGFLKLKTELEEAYHQREQMQAVSAQGMMEEQRPAAQQKLQEESAEIRDQLLALDENDHKILFTGCSVNLDHVLSYVKPYLPEALRECLDGDSMDETVNRISTSIIASCQMSSENADMMASVQESVRSSFKWLFQRVWEKKDVEELEENLQEALLQKLLKNLRGILSDQQIMEIYNAYHRDESVFNIRNIVNTAVQKSFGIFQKTIERIMEATVQMIPSSFSYILTHFLHVGIKNETVCIEFTKQEDGRYRLAIYGGLSSHEHHLDVNEKLRMPLVFTNIEQGMITAQFIQTLLAFNVDSKWAGVSYTLADIYNAIHDYLDIEPQPLETETSTQAAKGSDLNSIMHLLLRDRLSLQCLEQIPEEAQIDERQRSSLSDLVYFHLHRQALLDGWHQLNSNAQDFVRGASTLRLACFRVANEAQRLFDRQIITEDEKARSIATTWHILRLVSSKEQTMAPPQAEHPPVIIPDNIRMMIRGILVTFGMDKRRIDVVKKALANIIGDNVRGSINHIVDEIIGEMEQEQREATWSEPTEVRSEQPVRPPLDMPALKKSKIETQISFISNLISKVFSHISTYIFTYNSLAFLHNNLPASVINIFPPSLNPQTLIGTISLFATFSLEQLPEKQKNKVVNSVATFACLTVNTLMARVCFVVLEKALCMAFPAATVVSLLANPFITKGIYIGGGYVIGKLLPQSVIDWYHETIRQVQEYILFHVLTFAGNYFVTNETKEDLTTYFAKAESVITRSGHLHLDVPEEAALMGHALIKRPQIAALGAPEELEPPLGLEIEEIVSVVESPTQKRLKRSAENQTMYLQYERLPENPSAAVIEERLDVIIEKAERRIKQIQERRKVESSVRVILEDITQAIVDLSIQLPFLDTENPNIETNIWNRVEDKEKMLQRLMKVSMLLYQSALSNEAHRIGYPFHVQNQIKIAQFTFFAISNHLARQCPASQLEDQEVNLLPLALFVHQIYSSISNPEFSRRLENICEYFHIDPYERIPEKSLVEKYALGRLFFFEEMNRPETYSHSYTSLSVNYWDQTDESHFNSQKGFYRNPHRHYLLKLLDDPNTVARMQLHGIEPTEALTTRMAFLMSNPPAFKVLEEVAPEKYEETERVFKAGKHQEDEYLGLLPQPFYHLWIQSMLCETDPKSSSGGGRQVTSISGLQSLEKEGFFKFSMAGIGQVELLDPREHSWIAPVINPMIRAGNATNRGLHNLTRRTLLEKTITFPSLPHCSGLEPPSYPITKEFGLAFTDYPFRYQHNSQWIQSANLALNPSWNPLARSAEEDRQNGILNASPSEFEFYSQVRTLEQGSGSFFSERELQELAMIPLVDADQIIRTLSHLKQHPEKFKLEAFQHLFAMICLRLSSLTRQVEESEDTIRAFGVFFEEMLQIYMKDKDIKTTLFLAEMAVIFHQHIAFIDPAKTQLFLDIKKILLGDLMRLAQDLKEDPMTIKLLYNMAMVTYEYIDPLSLSDEERKVICHELFLLQHIPDNLPSSSRGSSKYEYVATRAVHTFRKWTPFMHRHANELAFRKRLIMSLLEAYQINIPEADLTIEWNSNAGTIKAFDTQRKVIIFEINVFNFEAYKISTQRALGPEEREQERPCLEEDGKRFYPVVLQQQRRAIEPEDTVVTLPDEILDVLPVEATHFWLEHTESHNQLLLVRNENQTLMTLQLSAHQDAVDQYDEVVDQHDVRILQRFKDEPEQTYCQVHFDQSFMGGLAPLRWFCPFEEMTTYAPLQRQNKIARVELPRYDLSLRVRTDEEEVERTYLHGRAGNYYLCEHQKDPTLTPFSQYLVFENEENQRKAFVSVNNFYTAIADPLCSRLYSVMSSDLVRTLANSVLETLSESHLPTKQRVFEYDITDSGLTSSDPSALIYLFIYNLINNNQSEIQRIFKELEVVARREALPREVLKLLPLLTLIASVNSSNENMRIIILKLHALFEENERLQKENAETAPEREENVAITVIQNDLLLFGSLQLLYKKYLDGVAFGQPPQLNEFEELFILRKIRKISHNMTESVVNQMNTEEIQYILNQLGIKFFADNFVLFSTISLRWRHLSQLHAIDDVEENDNLVNSFLLHWMHAPRGQQQPLLTRALRFTRILPQESSSFSLYRNVTKLLEVYASHPLFRFSKRNLGKDLQLADCVRRVKTNVEDLTEVPLQVEELTEANLEQYFIAYYCLCRKTPLPEWVDTVEKRELFEKRSQLLQKSIALKKGRYPIRHQLFLEYLKAASMHGNPYNLPKGIILRNMFALSAQELELRPSLNPEQELMNFQYKRLAQFFAGIHSNFTTTSILKFFKERTFSYVKSKNGLLSDVSTWAVGFAASSALGLPGITSVFAGVRRFSPMIEQLSIAPTIYSEMKKAKAKIARQRQELLAAAVEQDSGDLSRTITARPTRPAPERAQEAPVEMQPATVAELLQDADTEVETLLQSTFRTHLEEEEIVPPEPILVRAPQEASHLVRTHFDKLNRSLQCHFETLARRKIQLKRLTLQDIGPLQTRLTRLDGSLGEHIKLSEEEILSFVNDHREKLRREDISVVSVMKREQERERINFDELLTLCLHDNDALIMRKTHLSVAQVQKVKVLVSQHLVMATRRQQIQNIHATFDKLKKAIMQGKVEQVQPLIDELTFEITRSRSYHFGNLPKKLVVALLFFEYRNKILLKDRQTRQLIRMLTNENPRLVLQLIMGEGKTFMGMPMASFWGSRGDRFTINFFASSIFHTNSRQISSQLRRTFGQESTSLSIKRTDKLTEEDLWAILKLLQRALVQKEHIHMRKTDAQAFELKFIDECYKAKVNNDTSAETMRCLYYYMKILEIIRKQAIGNIDEIHEQFEPTDELNYPVGPKTFLEASAIKVAERCMYYLMEVDGVRDLLQIRENQQALITREVYDRAILPVLAQKIASDAYFLIAQADQAEVILYLQGRTRTIPRCVLDSPLKKQIHLARGYLREILPASLEKISSVDFGPSHDNRGEYARPYKGNETPDENATIRNPYEAAIKSFISLIQRRLSKPQIARLIRLMEKSAKKESEKHPMQLKEHLPTYRVFARCSGGFDIYNLPRDRMEEIYQNLVESNEFTLLYGAQVVCPKIFYFTLNIQSNAQNFGSMFAGQGFYSFTGTPYNAGTYPHGTKVLEAEETTGETVDHIQRQAREMDSVEVLDVDRPFEILDVLLDRHFKLDPSGDSSNYSALIDAGALFRGKSDEVIARRILTFLERERPDMDGVVFYDSQKREVIIVKGSTRPMLLADCRIPPEKRITFLGNANTFGVDVKQPINAKALVTVGENITAEKRIYQAVWRMRGLKKLGQSICFVLTHSMKKLIVGEERDITADDIMSYGTEEEAEELGDNHFASDSQKIEDQPRRAVLDKMIFLSDPRQMFNIFCNCMDLFVTPFVDDPCVLYGMPQIQVPPERVLEAQRQEQMQVIAKTGLFYREERRAFERRLHEIGHNTYPATVPISVDGNKFVFTHDAFGQTQQLELAQEQDTQREEEVELDLQHEQDLRQTQNPDNADRNKYYPSHVNWTESLDIRQTDWLTIVSPRTTLMGVARSCFGAVSSLFTSSFKTQKAGPQLYDFRQAIEQNSDAIYRRVASTISPIVFSSANFTPFVQGIANTYTIPPGTSKQKPIFEVLVIEQTDQSGRKNLSVGLLDQHDARFWRKKLKEDRKRKGANPIRYALWDIHTRAVVSSSKTPISGEELLRNEAFMLAQVQLKFLNACTSYTEDEKVILKRWIHLAGIDATKPVFMLIHDKLGTQEYLGSTIEEVFRDEENALYSAACQREAAQVTRAAVSRRAEVIEVGGG